MKVDLTGQIVSARYRLLRRIGEGAMGEVYEAEHVDIGRRVAIKVLRPHCAIDPGLVKRFRREARAATSIGHPNIIEVTDFGALDDGRVYSVMELLCGGDLADVMARGPLLPLARALHIALQVCDALHAAHEAGIVHRDLKPENIFLIERDGTPDFVKILDFGIAMHMPLNLSQESALTLPGTTMGTPEYMAPEQGRGLRVDRRADLYAVGTLLYELLTGRLPYTAPTPLAVLEQKFHGLPTPPRQVNPALPEAIDGILLRALDPERERRYATMKEFATALLPLRDEAAAAAAEATPSISLSRLEQISEDDTATRPLSPTRLLDHLLRLPGRWGLQVIFSGAIVLTAILVGTVYHCHRRDAAPLPAEEHASAQAPVTATANGVVAATPAADPVRPPLPPPPAVDPESATERLEGLLARAHRAAARGRITVPPEENVRDLLAQIDAMHPGHPAVAAARVEICDNLMSRGARAEERRRYTRAEASYHACLALRPDWALPRVHLVALHLRQGNQALRHKRLSAAATHAEQAYALAPEYARVNELVGDVAMQQRRYANAVTAYRAALKGKLDAKRRRTVRSKLARARRLAR